MFSLSASSTFLCKAFKVDDTVWNPSLVAKAERLRKVLGYRSRQARADDRRQNPPDVAEFLIGMAIFSVLLGGFAEGAGGPDSQPYPYVDENYDWNSLWEWSGDMMGVN